MRISELKVDPEFRDCLPKLTDEEFSLLEQNVLRYGIQTPLIVWNGLIVDGHNRYSICLLNNIKDVPVREEYFEDRNEVLEWILENQLGRRNLTDFSRNEIALRYKDVIARKAKERQREGQAAGRESRYSGLRSNDQKPDERVNTRTEIAKIAGTNDSSVKRTEFILKHGNEEEKARARQGGRGNSQAAVVNDIKKRIIPEGHKLCPTCNQVKPNTEFHPNKSKADGLCSECIACEKDRKHREYQRKTDSALLAEVEQLTAEMYSNESTPFTASMLKDEIETNGFSYVDLLRHQFEDRKELLTAENIPAFTEVVNSIIDAIEKIKEELL